MRSEKNLESFGSGSVPKAVLKNVLTAMAAQLMVLVYHLADTFFIARTHNDYMVAGVALATPVFLVFMAVGTLFGIGGTSVISRSLGAGKRDYARKVSAFCVWGCVAVGAVLMLLMWVFKSPLLRLLGVRAETEPYTRSYMNVVVACGIFSMLSTCCSHIIRAEGGAAVATTGTVIGNLLNVILDPILISGLGWDAAGAAAATVVGNTVAAGYFILYFLRGKSILSVSPRDVTLKDGVPGGVLAIGFPAALGTFLMSVSQVVVQKQMTRHGDLAVAAYGVAAKVSMIFGTIGISMGMGVQPLLGYCHGAKDRARFGSILRFSCCLGLAFGIAASLLVYVFTEPIVRVFLTEPAALADGVTFVRILISTAWTFGLYYALLNTLQAMGAARPSFICSVCRQGLIFIPAVFVVGAILGKNGLVWAQPVADVLSLLLVSSLVAAQLKKLKNA